MAFSFLRPLAALALCAVLAHGEVVVYPPKAELKARGTRAFQVAALAPAGEGKEASTERKRPLWRKPSGTWRWAVEGGPEGLVDPLTGVFTAPYLDEAKDFTLVARSEDHPGQAGRATVHVRAAGDSTEPPPLVGMTVLARNLGGEPKETKETKETKEEPDQGLGGIAVLSAPGDPCAAYLVADPGNHVIHRVTDCGKKSILCGRMGTAGYAAADGAPLFKGPTHLVAVENWGPVKGRAVLVADSGNHVIRILRADGSVGLLAGEPGKAGWRDADQARAALFCQPMGLAVHPGGILLVADRGNQVIRRITPQGKVDTVAGSRGTAGNADGYGNKAHFSHLGAVVADPTYQEDETFFFLDGHALRQLRFDPEGAAEVTTYLGQVGTPGVPCDENLFRDLEPREPLLASPWGLALGDGQVLIADQGNHSLHAMVDSGDGWPESLATLLGHWTEPRTRPGFLRGLVAPPLDPCMATVKAPRGLLALGPRSVLMTTENDLLLVQTQPVRDADGDQEMKVPGTASGGWAQVRLTRLPDDAGVVVEASLPCNDALGREDLRPVKYWVDFYNPDQSLAMRKQGEAVGRTRIRVQGGLTRPGNGRVLLVALLPDGQERSARLPLSQDFQSVRGLGERRITIIPRELNLMPGEERGFSALESGRPGLPGAPLAFPEAAIPGDLGLESAGAEAEPFLWTAWDVRAKVPYPITAQGRITARPLQHCAREIRIRATSRKDPALWGEATVHIMPHALFPATKSGGGTGAIIAGLLGLEWTTPVLADLPFMEFSAADPAAPGRRPPGARVVSRAQAFPSETRELDYPAGDLIAGCGLPRTLVWTGRPDADGQRLTLMGPDGLACHDVTGLTSLPVTLYHGATAVAESLKRKTPDGPWESRMERCRVTVQGMGPWLGGPAPGGEDGRHPAASFRRPGGMTRILDEAGGVDALLIADPEDHTVRICPRTGERRVETLCGNPGRPGFLNHEEGGQALFKGPTYLAHRWLEAKSQGAGKGGGKRWQAIIADSGNHAIRGVTADGVVTLIAGGEGEGHRDDWQPGEARFRDPQGLAVSPLGDIFVADRGNRVIRVITPEGRVGTVAGVPHQAGSADGPARKATFTDLKGLALNKNGHGQWELWILDGHALRRLNLATLQVDTVLGVVDTPGFRDGPVRDAEQKAPVACLKGPTDLFFQPGHRGRLYIVDRDNEAIRLATQEGHGFDRITTVVGSPAHPGIRMGLLRTDIPEPLEDCHATLRQPFAGVPLGAGRFLLTTGSQVVGVTLPDPRSLAFPSCRLEVVDPAVAGRPCRIRFKLRPQSTIPKDGPASFKVAFEDPGGQLAEEVRLEGRCLDTLVAEGTFTRPGPGARVTVRGTDFEGTCTFVEQTLEVQAPPPDPGLGLEPAGRPPKRSEHPEEDDHPAKRQKTGSGAQGMDTSDA